MTGTPSRMIYLAIAGSACLVALGAGAFWYATTRQPAQASAADRLVTVDARSCVPNEITVPGGRRSFEILNSSDRPIEWEILNGVMVVAERENIAPGFRTTLVADLAPGSYEMTCGLLSNPRGRLIVTASDEATTAASEVTLRKFLGPLSEYRVYLVMQGNQAVKKAEALRDAVAAGDLDAARAAWREARLPYRRVEPLAYRLSDLENAIDPHAAYLAGREEDPAFTGYHRLEYGLFQQNSTDGLQPFADRLVEDLKTLSARLKEMPLDPQLLIALPGDMAQQIATGQIPEGENSYAGNDAEDLAASLEGITKLTDLLGQVTASVDPALDEEIGQALQKSRDGVAALGDVASYAEVPAATRSALAQDLLGLADSLSRLQPVIGKS